MEMMHKEVRTFLENCPIEFDYIGYRNKEYIRMRGFHLMTKMCAYLGQLNENAWKNIEVLRLTGMGDVYYIWTDVD